MGLRYALQEDRVNPFQFSKAFREGVGRRTTLRATGTWTTWERLKGDKAALLWGSQWLRKLRKKIKSFAREPWVESPQRLLYQKSTQNWPEPETVAASPSPAGDKLLRRSLLPLSLPPSPPISQFRRTELWNWKGKELTRIRPFFHPTPNLSATSLVYWGDGRGVARRSSTCDFSPYGWES